MWQKKDDKHTEPKLLDANRNSFIENGKLLFHGYRASVGEQVLEMVDADNCNDTFETVVFQLTEKKNNEVSILT